MTSIDQLARIAYLFNRHTLIDFVRAVANAQGAPDA